MKYDITINRDKPFEVNVLVGGKNIQINCKSTAQITLRNDYGITLWAKNYGYVTLEEITQN
jgi:hypothetical protein